MNLRNYTSEIPASRSIENIEKLLVDLGCCNLSKFYEEKETAGILFQLMVNSEPLAFKLPCKVDLIYKRMVKGRSKLTDDQKIKLRKQAARTAWKTLYELVQIQCDLIMLEQSDVIEAFLPYAFDGQRTLREKIEDNGMKLLTEGQETEHKGGKIK